MGCGPSTGGAGGLPPGFLPVACAFSSRAAQLGAMLRHLLLEAFLGAGFKLGAGLGKLGQTLLTARQFLRNRHAVHHISLIGGFRPCQQFGHFGLQLAFDLGGMFIGQRAVPAGIGVDLGAIQRHRAKLEQAHLAGQFQHPHEQRFDVLEKAPTKRRNGVVVGMIVRRNEAERHRIIGRPLQLAARKHAGRIAINQQPQQQGRMITGRPGAAIAPHHRRKVQPVDHLDNKPRQMPLGKPVIERGRKQKSRVAVKLAEIAHRSAPKRESIAPQYPASRIIR